MPSPPPPDAVQTPPTPPPPPAVACSSGVASDSDVEECQSWCASTQCSLCACRICTACGPAPPPPSASPAPPFYALLDTFTTNFGFEAFGSVADYSIETVATSFAQKIGVSRSDVSAQLTEVAQMIGASRSSPRSSGSVRFDFKVAAADQSAAVQVLDTISTVLPDVAAVSSTLAVPVVSTPTVQLEVSHELAKSRAP